MHGLMVDSPRATEADLYAFVIGATVAQLREKNGWTQGDLASRVGVGQPAISRIEHGVATPDAHQLRALAGAFGMTATELTGLIEVGFAKATDAARNAVKGPAKDDWWKAALAVVGAVGLGGLAGFAAALALNERDRQKAPTPPRTGPSSNGGAAKGATAEVSPGKGAGRQG